MLLAAAVLVLMPACSSPGTPAGGDPGNKHLHELSADPIFTSLPPGANIRGSIATSPARYTTPGVEAGGWSGPTVTVTFTSASSAQSIYSFYGQRALAAGWHDDGTGALGYVDGWKKTYGDGATGYLSLFTLDSSPTSSVYQLAGGI